MLVHGQMSGILWAFPSQKHVCFKISFKHVCLKSLSSPNGHVEWILILLAWDSYFSSRPQRGQLPMSWRGHRARVQELRHAKVVTPSCLPSSSSAAAIQERNLCEKMRNPWRETPKASAPQREAGRSWIRAESYWTPHCAPGSLPWSVYLCPHLGQARDLWD
jgi:hypothetical protein